VTAASPFSAADERFMRRALALAERGQRVHLGVRLAGAAPRST